MKRFIYSSGLLLSIAGCMDHSQFVSTAVDPNEQLRIMADYECTRDLHQSIGFGQGWSALIGTHIFYDKCMAAHGYVRK